MISAFERLIAFRYLRARRQEGFISVVAWFSLIGIMLGVATLIIVMSVMNGFRAELLSRILGLNGHIEVTTGTGAVPGYDDFAARIAALDGVVSVTPMVEGQVMATANGVAAGALVRGLRAEDFLGRELLADSIEQGSLAKFDEGDGLIVGSRFARRFGLGLGDKVKLISPDGTSTPFGTVPRTKSYPIVAIFDVGMSEYDSSFVFMPLEAAKTFFKFPNSVSKLEVFLTDADNARRFMPELATVLGPGFRIFDWQQKNSSFFTALKVERNVMFLILTLIILVAAFNIISSQVMLVQDKGKGIAILRTMGATRATILKIFFITGASVGVIGTVFGAALGIAFAVNIETIRQAVDELTGSDVFSAEIYFLSQLPAKIDPSEVVMVIVMALALSFLASI
ncbi:MAG: lipoprotein-releasing ABC transporter permease subunit, partial [Pseudomonadota bacterium]